MSDKRYLGNIITDTPTAPSSDLANSSAKGVWSLEEQLAYQKAGLWPVPGNFPLDITDVFSTYLYTGTGSAQTITNGIDLAGEGGLTWMKARETAYPHLLFDTERGVNKFLYSNLTDAQQSYNGTLTSFNSDGFSIGTNPNVYNISGEDFASWTFRKAPKFFDVGTISFNSSGVGSYSHNLGVTPAMVIFKLTNTTGDWFVWHKDLTSQNYAMFLNSTAASSNQGGWATYTDTTVSFNSSLFANDTAVVYLFAHNDGDGDFGDGSQDIIKCGSYTGNGSTDGPVIDLGFEPQWLMIKSSSLSENWHIFDNMRGVSTGGDDSVLYPNLSSAESTSSNWLSFTSTGFKITATFDQVNSNTNNYIYMAIRRGPLAVPTDATKVFAPNFGDTNNAQGYLGHVADWALTANRNSGTYNFEVFQRLTQTSLLTSATDAEVAISGNRWDNMIGYRERNETQNTEIIVYTVARAPGYFDVVAYTGDGTGSSGSGRAVAHNLTVPPEMLWVKQRNTSGEDWWVYHSGLDATAPENYNLILNATNAKSGVTGAWANTAPTDTSFFLDQSPVNASGGTFIAYLFASAPGVSKVGSASHSGTTNVDCGFTSGARLVLLKRTDASGSWYVWDSVRGIVAGNDPYLLLNEPDAEVTNTDYIDPLSSGFTITSSFTAGTYIFYAIA